jgi:hypothetical protein
MIKTLKTGIKINGFSRKASCYEFESVGEFVQTCAGVSQDIRTKLLRFNGNQDSTWQGAETYDETLALCSKGREDWAKIAEGVYDLLETGGIELEMHTWQADRAGAFPIVPDYVAGIPENMRRKIITAADTAPMSVYLNIAASASYTADDMLKRGAACTALVMALQQHRAVSMYLLAGINAGQDATFISIKIDTVPADLSQIAYLLGSASVFRKLIFALGFQYGDYTGKWPFGTRGTDLQKEIDQTREILGLEPQDLLIPGIHAADTSVKSPVNWIEGHLAKYKQEYQS